jgi:hypothetical protein
MSRSLCDPSLRQSTEEGCEFPVGHITRWVRSGDKDVVKMCIVVVSILIILSFVFSESRNFGKDWRRIVDAATEVLTTYVRHRANDCSIPEIATGRSS